MKKDTLRIHSRLSYSRANGPGLRAVVWLQGCPFRCYGCFNEDLRYPNGGKDLHINKLITFQGLCLKTIGEARIDHTTLFKFYQRLETDGTARDLFTTITDEFIKACGTSVKKQRTDSFFIHGWLQTIIPLWTIQGDDSQVPTGITQTETWSL